MRSVLIIFLILSLKNFSQTTFSLISVQPFTVCACDSVSISVKVHSYISASVNYSLYFRYPTGTSTYQYVLLDTLRNTDFYKMIKTQQGPNDTVYTFREKTSCDISKYSLPGFTSALLDFCQNPTDTDPKKTIRVVNCTVGIPIYQPNEAIPVYFDLFMHPIERRTNEVMIEQIGDRRHLLRINE